MSQDEGQPLATRLGAATLYMLTAASLVVFNKIALSKYNFPYANIMVLCQLLFSFVSLHVLGSTKTIQLEKFNVATLKATLPLSLTFVLFLVMGMVSLRGVNIAMYTALRRLTLVFVMGLDYIMLRKASTIPVRRAVAIMVLGAFVAAVRDLEFDAYAYGNVLAYNMLTALYLVLISRTKASTKLSTFGMMQYNNLVCIPALAGLCLVDGSFAQVHDFAYFDDLGFVVSLLGSTVLAFVLNYAIFFNTAVNSALTQSVCGQLKDVLTVAFGVLFVDTVAFDPLNALGIAISFGGSGLYAYAKYVEALEATAHLPPPAAHGKK